MSDTFVPLTLANASNKVADFAPVARNAPADAAARPVFDELLAASSDPSHSPEVCAKPSVTLQREGDVVTGIRIQCGCGRVIELACVY